jgi:riboflavin kinase / FMN adenylyltransferase
MKHTDSLEEMHLSGALLTIGAFDGVHRGHQELLGALVRAAGASGVPSVVLTFHPHPAVVLRGIEKPFYLTSPEERARLFGQLGIDWVITLPFTRELAQESAGSFVARLQAALGLREMWVGYDFALGKGREGDISFLRRLGEEMGYSVRVIDPVSQGGQTVSSSQVRALLTEGAVRPAAELLGRRYGFSGPVIHGDGRGRSLGIPTANIQAWDGQLLPRLGVYATWVWVAGVRYPAVTNVGFRPTFDSPIPAPRVEALLLDYDQDLYGQEVRLEFVDSIRPEQRFESVDALLKQIAADRERAREILTHDR